MPRARFALLVPCFVSVLGAAPAQIISETHDPEVVRIAGLQGKAQQRALRLFLSRPTNNHFNLFDSLFYYEAELRPALRPLALDRRLGMFVADFLTLVGETDDLRLVIHHPPRWKRRFDSTRWAYGAACSLLNASTEEDWRFLRSCAERKYWGRADSGAIRTLKLIASPKS